MRSLVPLLFLASCAKPVIEPPACATCHAQQSRALAASHHANAQRDEHDGGYALGVELTQFTAHTEDGRLNVTPRAWVDGGLRDVPHSLPGPAGAWTTPSFSWAGSCAPCHATGFRLGTAPDGTLHPTWKDIAVTCEACHGDASGHRAWVMKQDAAAPNAGFGWTMRRDSPADAQSQVCASCHSRRRPVEDEGEARPSLLDRYEPQLLSSGLFLPDGRGGDEVFESASFAMSRMHRAGVRCSHCHEPHSAQLRSEPAVLCRSCHAAHRDDGSCVGCHMPSTVFLGSQERHDHRFFSRRPSWANAFEAAFEERAGAATLLEAVLDDESAGAFVRASAAALLPPNEKAIHSTDDLIRFGAASSGAAALLSDVRLATRVRAARASRTKTPELARAEQVNAFRGDAWLNLAALESGDEALRLLRAGRGIDPTFVPLTVNLADRVRGDEGLKLLDEVGNLEPWSATVATARGLALIRAGRKDEALRALAQGAAGSPHQEYVYRVALRELRGAAAGWEHFEPRENAELMLLQALWLRDDGRESEALSVAKRLLELEPSNRAASSLEQELKSRR